MDFGRSMDILNSYSIIEWKTSKEHIHIHLQSPETLMMLKSKVHRRIYTHHNTNLILVMDFGLFVFSPIFEFPYFEYIHPLRRTLTGDYGDYGYM